MGAAVPKGYRTMERQDGAGLLVRDDVSDALLAPLLEDVSFDTVLAFSGRGAVSRVLLADGSFVAARPYRHGGLFGDLLGSRGMGWARAVVEIQAGEQLRAAGIPTPDIVGAFFRAPGWKEPVLLTRVVDGVRIEELDSVVSGHWREPSRDLADLLARAFAAGVIHPDLNLTNFLFDSRGRSGGLASRSGRRPGAAPPRLRGEAPDGGSALPVLPQDDRARHPDPAASLPGVSPSALGPRRRRGDGPAAPASGPGPSAPGTPPPLARSGSGPGLASTSLGLTPGRRSRSTVTAHGHGRRSRSRPTVTVHETRPDSRDSAEAA